MVLSTDDGPTGCVSFLFVILGNFKKKMNWTPGGLQSNLPLVRGGHIFVKSTFDSFVLAMVTYPGDVWL